jgi:hypothetical protein
MSYLLTLGVDISESLSADSISSSPLLYSFYTFTGEIYSEGCSAFYYFCSLLYSFLYSFGSLFISTGTLYSSFLSIISGSFLLGDY